MSDSSLALFALPKEDDTGTSWTKRLFVMSVKVSA